MSTEHDTDNKDRERNYFVYMISRKGKQRGSFFMIQGEACE